MTLTIEQEKILKITAAITKAKIRLNKVNVDMLTEIRVACKPLSDTIRATYSSLFIPLETEIKNKETELKTLLE